MQEGIRHRATDRQHIDLADQIAQQFELGGYLGPADNRADRSFGIAERGFQRVEFSLHHAAGGGRQQTGHGVGRCVRPVRGGKRVIHVDIGKGSELTCEIGIAGLFAGVKPEIFQQHHIAGRRRADHLRRFGADAVIGK